jgi:hypothetical protein
MVLRVCLWRRQGEKYKGEAKVTNGSLRIRKGASRTFLVIIVLCHCKVSLYEVERELERATVRFFVTISG